MVLVVTEATSPRLLALNQPMGRYRRCSAISIRLLAQVRYPPRVWSMVDFILMAMLTSTDPTTMARLLHRVVVVTLFSNSATITMYAAGMRMAVQMALSTPSQMAAVNSLRLSSPQKLKNFFSVCSIYATSPSLSLTLMWASHMFR